MSEKLKDCPFCGGKDVKCREIWVCPPLAPSETATKRYQVDCLSCMGHGSHKGTVEAAIDFWNTRTPAQADGGLRGITWAQLVQLEYDIVLNLPPKSTREKTKELWGSLKGVKEHERQLSKARGSIKALADSLSAPPVPQDSGLREALEIAMAQWAGNYSLLNPYDHHVSEEKHAEGAEYRRCLAALSTPGVKGVGEAKICPVCGCPWDSKPEHVEGKCGVARVSGPAL